MNIVRKRFYFGLSLVLIGFILLAINIWQVHHIGASLMALFLTIAAAFFAKLFLQDDRNWWAIIPAGVAFSLATVIILHAYHLLSAMRQGVVFLLGIALTFGLLWRQRNPDNHLDWSIYPAAGAGFIAILLYLGDVRGVDAGTVIAFFIVTLGTWLLIKALRS